MEGADLWVEIFLKLVFLPISALINVCLYAGYPIPILKDPSSLVSLQVAVLGTSLPNLNYRSRGLKRNKGFFAFLFLFGYCSWENLSRKNNKMDGISRCDLKCLNIGGCGTNPGSLHDTTSLALMYSQRFKNVTISSESLEARGKINDMKKKRKNDNPDTFIRNVTENSFKIIINGRFMIFNTSQSCAIMEQTKRKAKIADINRGICSNSTRFSHYPRDSLTTCGLLRNRKTWFIKKMTSPRLYAFSDTLKTARNRSYLPLEIDSFLKIATSFVLSSYYPDYSEFGIPVQIFTQVPTYLSGKAISIARIVSFACSIVLWIDVLFLISITYGAVKGERRSLLE